ncbi:MAG: alpha/beta hydrolase [Thermoanaerobaculia bacterium]
MIQDLEIIVRNARGCADGRPPLLFVHGVFHGAWCWDEHFLGFFADRGWNAYALSLRGHRRGDDARSVRRWRIADYVRDVQSVADALPEEPVLIGHSMGAYIVGKVVERRRTPAVVLLTPMPGIAGLRSPFLRRNALVLAAGFARGRLKPIFGTPERCRSAFFSAFSDDHLVARYTSTLTEESVVAVAEMLFGRRPRVPPVGEPPVLVMGASEDGIFSPRQIYAAAARYGTTPLFVSRTGHDMMLEESWRVTACYIDVWLGAALARRR